LKIRLGRGPKILHGPKEQMQRRLRRPFGLMGLPRIDKAIMKLEYINKVTERSEQICEIITDGTCGIKIGYIRAGGPDGENPGLALTCPKKRAGFTSLKGRFPAPVSGTIRIKLKEPFLN